MTRKQATIAVRSGLNDDEQYGCVVPPIHLSSTYNFTGFNEPRAHDYSRRGNPTRDVTQRALGDVTRRIAATRVVMRAGFIKSGEIIGAGEMNWRDNAAVLLVIIQSATHCDGGLFTRHGEASWRMR